ncbi:hypothetical protein QTP86_008148 [Hemibagrus guttatus]|nr:hypothetical protein QTP86_008148 [Hemibagrus guttatus]
MGQPDKSQDKFLLSHYLLFMIYFQSKLRVNGYGSRTLTKAERNYRLHSSKLEFLALKSAVCKKFWDYLFYAQHFMMYTDNNSLTYVMSTAKLNAVGHRWVVELSDFRLVEPEEETTPKGYAKQWAHRMSEVYKIAESPSQQSSARGKAQNDRKVSGVVLKAGDPVLVRNLGERGGPGKLRSYWKKAVYVVKEQVSNNPVYVVYPENSDRGKTRTLHQNLLLLVNDLPVEAPAKTPASTRPERQKRTVRHTSNDNMDDKDSDLASSDAESSAGGYWLRAPVNWPTSGSDQPPEQVPVREKICVLQVRENIGQNEDREVQRTSESPADRRTVTYLEVVTPVYTDEGDRANTESESDGADRAEGLSMEEETSVRSESREQVEENLERWRFALERRGMKVSCSKTEYMCVNEKEGSGTVRLQGEEVKKVQEFKYLGSTVQSNGQCGKEVKKRVQAGWNGWRKVSGVLCDRKISARIKGKVYRTVVRPAMLYGLETVSLRKRQESELEVAELKMLRFSLGVTRLDRIRNEYIRGTAHVGRLGDKVREARLRWFGHVQRREKNISENQGEGVQDSGETGHAVWFRDSVTEEETGVRARASSPLLYNCYSPRHVKANMCFLMNFEVNLLLKARDVAFKSGDAEDYSRARANMKRGIRKAKHAHKLHIEEHFHNNSNPRCMWKGIQTITDHKPAIQTVPTSNAFLPDELNHFFARFNKPL